MVEKKATAAKTASKTTTSKATTSKVAAKKPAVKKTTAAKEDLILDAINAGYKAGDVYQTLAAAEKALTLAEIAKTANISTEDAILGIGWLFKEGKIKSEDNKVALA